MGVKLVLLLSSSPPSVFALHHLPFWNGCCPSPLWPASQCPYSLQYFSRTQDVLMHWSILLPCFSFTSRDQPVFFRYPLHNMYYTKPSFSFHFNRTLCLPQGLSLFSIKYCARITKFCIVSFWNSGTAIIHVGVELLRRTVRNTK